MLQLAIGRHISIRGGYLAAARTAKEIGANAFQYFPKNPRSLSVKAVDLRDSQACKLFCRENAIVSIAHTAYPVNIASDDAELRKQILQSLINDFDIAEACGSLGVVVHFGHYKGNDPLQGYKNSIKLCNDLFDSRAMESKILLENQAGGGTMMGTSFEELVAVRQLSSQPAAIGFCLDTCHLFASGLWDGTNWYGLEKLGEDIGFFEHLAAVHLNDSRYESGFHKDRHANIGQGKIGERAFREFLGSAFIRPLPLILETPASNVFSYDEEIRLVRSLT